MKKIVLVEYGAQTLTNNPNFKVFQNPGARDHKVELQTLKNARSSGSTPVNVRIEEKQITLSCQVQSDEQRTLEEVWTELNRSLEDYGRNLRFIRTWEQITPLSTDTGWVLTDDAINRSLTYTTRWLEAGIQFDLDVSVSGNNQATITNTSLDGVDLSQYDGKGNFEFWFDLNNIDYLSGLVLAVGSDTNNYLVGTFTTQADGSALVEGRNKFSIAWADMSETGNPDAGLMGRFIQVQLQYTSSQTDTTGIVFGGLIWQYDENTVNYKCYSLGIQEKTVQEFSDHRKFDLSFNAYRGIGEGTNREIVYTASSVSAVSSDFTIELGGSFTPEPSLKFTFSAVTNLQAVAIYNKSTGDIITISRTWSVGDVLEVDSDSKTVKINNSEIDYTSVIPRFILGRNKMNVSLSSTSESVISQTTNNSNLRGEI